MHQGSDLNPLAFLLLESIYILFCSLFNYTSIVNTFMLWGQIYEDPETTNFCKWLINTCKLTSSVNTIAPPPAPPPPIKSLVL